MTSVFRAAERRKKLESVVKDWIGVPYFHMGESRGGVDCVKMLAEIFVAVGVLQKYEKGVFYPLDWYLHGHEQILVDSLLGHAPYLAEGLSWSEVLDGGLVYGDILTFWTRRPGIFNHAGLYLEDCFLHCTERIGVHLEKLSAGWAKRAGRIFRVVEVK